MAAFDSYIICTSPRCGSTLLCEMLAGTGIAGVPESYFHARTVAACRADLGLSAEQDGPAEALAAGLLGAVVARGRGRSDLFGLRLQRHSFDLFMQVLGAAVSGSGDRDRIGAVFGRTLFVYLFREDKLAQAVSYAKAVQSGLWHIAPDGTEIERLSPPAKPRYDAMAIARHLHGFEADDRDWLTWFDREEIVPLRISYSALSDDPAGTVGRVLDALGLDPTAAAGLVPPVARLADAQSASWIARFRGERNGS